MPCVFISYRREDSTGYAGRLFDILSARLGRESTFMDFDVIRAGDNFVAVIEEKLALCDVLLALIGERWLTCAGKNGIRRLDMANDFVRLEIAKALERGVRVIPVLVGSATMPRQEDLPEDLRPLALRQAMDLRDAHFREDAERLVAVLHEKSRMATRLRALKSSRLAMAATGALLAAVGVFLLFPRSKPMLRANPNATAQNPSVGEKQAIPLPSPVDPVDAKKSKSPFMAPADIAGRWQSTVKYDWPGAIYPETFNFEVDGTEISGTASFLTADRGILDGKLQGDRVNFTTKSTSEMNDKTYQDKHLYQGVILGATIQFSMLTDSELESHVPIHFTATRIRTK